jgi:hypothetical protein
MKLKGKNLLQKMQKSNENLKKNNKEAGTNGIHPELIKYGGNKLLNRMYEIVRQIWEEEYLKN